MTKPNVLDQYQKGQLVEFNRIEPDGRKWVRARILGRSRGKTKLHVQPEGDDGYFSLDAATVKRDVRTLDDARKEIFAAEAKLCKEIVAQDKPSEARLAAGKRSVEVACEVVSNLVPQANAALRSLSNVIGAKHHYRRLNALVTELDAFAHDLNDAINLGETPFVLDREPATLTELGARYVVGGVDGSGGQSPPFVSSRLPAYFTHRQIKERYERIKQLKIGERLEIGSQYLERVS